jgi:hypothetical protein
MSIFSNDFAETNKTKACWRSLKSDKNKFNYLKSGQLRFTDFTVKLKSVGNLIKMIDDITPGRNSEHQIHEYQYDDTQYEIKYAYDFVLDTPFAKE